MECFSGSLLCRDVFDSDCRFPILYSRFSRITIHNSSTPRVCPVSCFRFVIRPLDALLCQINNTTFLMYCTLYGHGVVSLLLALFGFKNNDFFYIFIDFFLFTKIMFSKKDESIVIVIISESIY